MTAGNSSERIVWEKQFDDIESTYREAVAMHKEKAAKWYAGFLWPVIITAALVLFLMLFQFLYQCTTLSNCIECTSEPLQLVSSLYSRTILFLILLGLSSWSARNFRVHKHLQTVYERRLHTIRTLRKFLELHPGDADKDDKEIRKCAVEEGLKALFQPISTGFLPKEEVVNVTLTSLTGVKATP